MAGCQDSGIAAVQSITPNYNNYMAIDWDDIGRLYLAAGFSGDLKHYFGSSVLGC